MSGMKWTWVAVAVGLLTGPAALANETRDYGPSGRVSAVEGTLFGKGPYDTDTSELAQNAVLRQGDQVWTDEGTFAEIELPGRTFLRLAGATSVTIERLDNETVDIGLSQGAAYLSRGSGASAARFITPAGTIELGGTSMVRGGLDASNGVEVSVAAGNAELRGQSGAQVVQPRETLTMQGGRPHVEGFDPARGDAFDRWNADRESRVRGATAPEHVADNIVGSYELDGNGTWVQIDGYWAWRPTVVGADWRPYSSGYWAWTEPWGWSWVDYAPWGYTTCHYGRWYYRGAWGWVWYPDPVWAPAWVVWAAFDASIGWAPCDFWGRPIYCYSYYSYYDYGAWCYCDADYFWYGGGYHYYDGDDYGRHGGGGYAHDGHVATTARHESPRPTFGKHQLGRDGKFAIKKFDADSMKRVSPVPVRDPVRELTPKNVVAAAAAGKIRGVSAADRRGELLNRAATGGGVKPEPWNRRPDLGGSHNDLGRRNDLGGGTIKSGASGVRDGGTAGDRLRTQGWSGRTPESGSDRPVSEGWNGRGATDNGGADHFRGPSDFGRGAGGASDQPASHFQAPDRNVNDGNRGGDYRAPDINRGGGNDNRGGSDYRAPDYNRGGSDYRAPDYNRGGGDNRGGGYQPPSRPSGSGSSGGSRPAPSAPSAPSRPAPSAPSAPSHPAPAPSKPSSSPKSGKHSSWSAPSGRSYASSSNGGFHFGGSSSGHSFSGGHSSGGGGGHSGGGAKFHFGKH